MNLLLLIVSAYFLGSVPFAVIIGKLNGVDILKEGSGNPGMTNVTRLLGRGWGILCFLLDVAKGFIPSLIARWVAPDGLAPLDPQMVWFLAGFAAVVGHTASIFLKFKGGKGVATSLGAIIATSPVVAFSCFGLFFVVLFATRYMAIASVVGVSSCLIFGVVYPAQSPQLLVPFALVSGYITYRHRANFKRLRAGTEPHFRFRKSEPSNVDPNPTPDTSE